MESDQAMDHAVNWTTALSHRPTMSSKVPEEWKDEVSQVLLDSETIRRRIRELGKQLSTDYQDRKPVLLGVLTGSFVFLADLIRTMSCDLEIRFMRAISYEGTESTGTVTIEGLEVSYLLLFSNPTDTVAFSF